MKVPLDLEDLFAYIDPDWLGYDATLHSERCYTVIILTLDYRYTAWRCNLSDDGRWSMNPLDWAGTFQLVTYDER